MVCKGAEPPLQTLSPAAGFFSLCEQWVGLPSEQVPLPLSPEFPPPTWAPGTWVLPVPKPPWESAMPLPRIRISDAGRGWVLKCGVGRIDLGRGVLLAAQTQQREREWRDAWNAPRGSMVCLESEEALLRGAWVVGLPPPTHVSSCFRCYWEWLPPEWVHHSLLQLLAGTCCSRQLAHTPTVVTIPLPSLSKCSPSSCCFHSLLPGQGTDAWGWHTHRGGVKTKAEPQGWCN